ncbi:hypothetical protein [Prauserella endophytica]|uniref:DUF2637 domain-containing protein n=1 Tax=Prauserella endophytica TaxID=1592324 RepID=A0ABY2S0K0_9PSEU|nr:hypothetical protein [Prauserella endophytica]TKG67522.1 hypothetical protein FCN18_22435 [Prauserella endophytica]
MSSYREERRKDRAAEAEQKRADALAAAEVEAVRAASLAQARRAAIEQAHAHEQQRAEAKRQAQAERRQARAARLAGLRAWAGAHVVDLLIYPLALVSAVMAVPAMAAYGHALYGGVTGLVLPVLSELGMWAFALAVQVSRVRTPERPVWALQAGVWLFAGVNFTLNLLHGLASGLSAGVAMGLVSVAGVVAHQLTVAGARRTRHERAETRLARVAARKTTRIRRAAIRQAVAEIDTNGTARLVFAPGRYVLTPRTAGGVLRGRRRSLVAAVVPGLPVEATPVEVTDWDAGLAALLANTTPPAVESTGLDGADSTDVDGGGVDTLDRPSELRESTPDQPTRRSRIPGPSTRSIEQLRAEFRAAVEAGRLDPSSAESIRKTLRCAAKTARQLRDEHKGDHR